MEQIYESFDTVELENISLMLKESNIPYDSRILDEDGLTRCLLFVDEKNFDSAADLIEAFSDALHKETCRLFCTACGSKNCETKTIKNEDSFIGSFEEITCNDCGVISSRT